MTTMTERLEDYIAVRRSLGYHLSFTSRVLRGFTVLPACSFWMNQLAYSAGFR